LYCFSALGRKQYLSGIRPGPPGGLNGRTWLAERKKGLRKRETVSDSSV